MKETLASILVAFVFAISAPAHAAQVSFAYFGTISGIDDGGSGDLTSLFSVGDGISGSYSFELNTPGLSLDPDVTLYENALTAFTLSIDGGAVTAALPSSPVVSDITVGNDRPAGFKDLYVVQSDLAFSNPGLDFFEMTFADTVGSLFSSQAIPDESFFLTGLTQINGLSGSAGSVDFDVTLLLHSRQFPSILAVPAPGSLVLLGFGLMGLHLRRRT